MLFNNALQKKSIYFIRITPVFHTMVSYFFVDMSDIELWSFTFEFGSETQIDCCLTTIQQFVQLYHDDENKLIFNEMIMRSALF